MRFHQTPKLAVVSLGVIFLCMFAGCGQIDSLMGPKGEKEPPRETVGGSTPETEPATPAKVRSRRRPAVAVPPESEMFVHTVRYPGESLSLIAKWYTGSLSNWKILADVNPYFDPNRIKIGDRIRIPKSLMQTEEPLPREFLPTFTPKEEEVTVAPEKEVTPAPEEEVTPAPEEEVTPAPEEEVTPAPGEEVPETEKLELFGPKK